MTDSPTASPLSAPPGISSERPAQSLWYDRPAGKWLEALPVGNGRLGAMVYGGLPNETLQLNEGSLWAGGPHDYASPDSLAALPKVRQAVFAGQWHEAQKLIDEHMMGRPVLQAAYQPVGSLHLDFRLPPSDPSGYRRDLDLESAVVAATVEVDGVVYRREVFASFPDQVIVVRVTASKPGRIAFSAGFTSPHEGAAASVSEDDVLLRGVSGPAPSGPGQVRFCARCRIVPEGAGASIGGDGSRVDVSGADAATLLISIGTSYEDWQSVSADPEARALAPLERAARKSFAALRDAHVADYRALAQRFSISLPAPDPGLAARPTDRRIETHAADGDPSLAALYCRYGRYLLIACSREGGLPATLQGLWNESLTPPWGSKFTVNINTEMNYWLAAPANLAACYAPLFDFLLSLPQSGARTARTQYGARGWVCHHNIDAWHGTAPVDGAFWGIWPTGGAWLVKSFWDHYEFTGDKAMLARHYPVMKSAAQFFLDTLVPDPARGWLVTCPSVSPENAHHPGASVCAGPAMDMQILRDLFDGTAQAARVLGADPDFQAEINAARARLAPSRIGAQGQLQEWMDDWDAIAPEQSHRHVSHLYGLYPSSQIDPHLTPDLFAAARKSLETRGDESTGWAMAWRINLWARLLDGDHAHKLLTFLLTPERTAPNMFDLHPPFQIDGNFGAAAGMIEMLVQSRNGVLDLLPALPSAWPRGSVSGVLARGGFEVAVEWAEGRLSRATVFSALGGTCRVRCRDRDASFETRPGHSYHLDHRLASA